MPDKDSALHRVNMELAALLTQSAEWKRSVLGALYFSGDDIAGRVTGVEAPCMHVPLPRLEGDDTVCEIWRGNGKQTNGVSGDIRYRQDEDLLFGVIELPESRFEASAAKTPLQQASESAYRQAFVLLDVLRFPHLVRFWNYIPGINAHCHGLERYRQFNLGRQEAFTAYAGDLLASAPAACALGSSQGPLQVAFLAAHVAPLRIENPRQINAFEYPPQYGPRSPIFSRATLMQLRRETVLMLSGTASIVGHVTMHPGDVGAQVRETVNNIQAVVDEANLRLGQSLFQLCDLECRVYVRHVQDLPLVRAELQRCVGQTLNAVYLQADICREDLLLEIEGGVTRHA